jgi:hypothetical protein
MLSFSRKQPVFFDALLTVIFFPRSSMRSSPRAMRARQSNHPRCRDAYENMHLEVVGGGDDATFRSPCEPFRVLDLKRKDAGPQELEIDVVSCGV